MNSKSNLLFRILVGLIIVSALQHLMSTRMGYYLEFPFVPISLFALNAIVLSVYGLIAFRLSKVRKSYHQQAFFSQVEIKQLKQIGFLLLFLVPINGLIETLRDSYLSNLRPSDLLLNFFSYSFFKSPSFLFAGLIVFILIEYIPVAEKNRTDLEEII